MRTLTAAATDHAVASQVATGNPRQATQWQGLQAMRSMQQERGRQPWGTVRTIGHPASMIDPATSSRVLHIIPAASRGLAGPHACAPQMAPAGAVRRWYAGRVSDPRAAASRRECGTCWNGRTTGGSSSCCAGSTPSRRPVAAQGRVNRSLRTAAQHEAITK